jgi:uncharacterized protein
LIKLNRNSDYWIETLQLTPHVEGGAFRETYRSALKFSGIDRNACTHIYFLLKQEHFSAFHRIQSDEIWHFYYGDPLIVYEIGGNGVLKEHKLGNDPSRGESFQCVIGAGNWFGSKVAAGGDYSLVGCTVSPGFDFNDFELADRKSLSALYPQHSALIRVLTR